MALLDEASLLRLLLGAMFPEPKTRGILARSRRIGGVSLALGDGNRFRAV